MGPAYGLHDHGARWYRPDRDFIDERGLLGHCLSTFFGYVDV
ncbi:MAG: hypothetical protein R2789_02055 [Microthrixaceae bacterium]